MQYLWILLFSICQSGGMVEYICQDKQCFLRFYIPRSGEQNSTERLVVSSPRSSLCSQSLLAMRHYQYSSEIAKVVESAGTVHGYAKICADDCTNRKKSSRNGKINQWKTCKAFKLAKTLCSQVDFPQIFVGGLICTEKRFWKLDLDTRSAIFLCKPIWSDEHGTGESPVVMVMVSECSRRRFGFKMMIMSRLMGKIT